MHKISKLVEALMREQRKQATYLYRRNIHPVEAQRSILKKLSKEGIVFIPQYFDAEVCAAIASEIEGLESDRDFVYWRDDIGSDRRIFGINHFAAGARNFFEDPFISSLAKAYYGFEPVGFTMFNEVQSKAENKGSGGGWHRDTVYGRQFKAILYLVDVDEGTGPFQYLPGSHKFSSVWKSIWNFDFDVYQNRLTHDQVQAICEKLGYRFQTFTGQAGGLILADTTGIHRGMPIQHGRRLALTNYYFEKTIPPHVQQWVNGKA